MRILLIISFVVFALACTSKRDVNQVAIARIEAMPERPSPYKYIDWREKAHQFDHYVFDEQQMGEFMPLIWKDDSKRNFNQETIGLYTVIGDIRQGPKNGKEFHEALNAMGALIGAGLTGIDKTKPINYVQMVQNYFNRNNGWNIMMNNTNPEVAMLGGGYGRDWWYDVFPNVLYYGVCDIFPSVARADSIQRIIANQFYQADSVLNGNYDYSYFDYKNQRGQVNQIPMQQDAAAGHAYVLLCASHKFGNRYLKRSKTAIESLLNQKENRFYEVLMPFGAYTAARLNAEENEHYDVKKLIDWTFNPVSSKTGRTGWGVVAERWGNYDVYGLQGNVADQGGYAFLMNTFAMAWPLLPLVKYQPQYSSAIAKWMLHASNAARFCYPYEIEDTHQWLPEKKAITKNVIAYEGIRKIDDYGKLKGVSPVALGDGPKWAKGQPDVSMYSLYGSSYAGIFGSIVQATNVEQILRLNCNATDFYAENNFPVFLYYNPFEEQKNISVEYASDKILFDVLMQTIVERDQNNSFAITPHSSRLLAVLPAQSKIVVDGNAILCNKKLVAYLPSKQSSQK